MTLSITKRTDTPHNDFDFRETPDRRFARGYERSRRFPKINEWSRIQPNVSEEIYTICIAMHSLEIRIFKQIL